MQRYLAVFALAALADLVFTFHLYCVARSWVLPALLSGSLIPYCNFLGFLWWVEDKTIQGRLLLTTATAAGMFLGSSVAFHLVGGF
jgi:hypothetical protein